jgi:hypothetical protein
MILKKLKPIKITQIKLFYDLDKLVRAKIIDSLWYDKFKVLNLEHSVLEEIRFWVIKARRDILQK